MTIRLPPDNLIDRILAIFNIHRRIILPKDDPHLSTKTPYITITAKKESLSHCLLRIIRK
jgi:hypothetical protein